MEIDITKVHGDLMYVAKRVGFREFSGNLFADVVGERIVVYDFVLLDVGSGGYTEIDPILMLPLIDRPDAKKMKGWVHKHPVGNGIPGDHNWSGTDEGNIWQTPLASTPELVKWSFSIVLTPGGWVGRVDNYVAKKTLHCPVVWFRQEIATKTEEILTTKGYNVVEETRPTFDQLFREFDYRQRSLWPESELEQDEVEAEEDEIDYLINVQGYGYQELQELLELDDDDLIHQFWDSGKIENIRKAIRRELEAAEVYEDEDYIDAMSNADFD